MGLGLLSPPRRPGLYGTGDYSLRPKAGTETAVLSQRLGLYGTGDCSPQPKVGTGTEALSTRSGPQSAVRDCMWLGTQCQARAHRCSNGLGCVEAGHAAHREHHGDTRMMCVPCGVEYRAHLKGLLHLLERGLRRLSWTLQVSPRSFVPWHTDERDEWHVGCHRPPLPGCRHQRIKNV